MPNKVPSTRRPLPAAGKDALIAVRLPPELIRAVDRWAQRDEVTRSVAIRRLLRSALSASRAATKLKITRR
jgi:metal-responsive CopG/Arc/MetJ family transcriptional regulator